MKPIIILFCFFTQITLSAQEFVIPKGYVLLEEKTGDLDKDGVPERVGVYNTTDTTEDGITREIFVLKQKDSKWTVWKRSVNAVLKSEQGGMMGDPFQEIDIKNGLLIISVAGGSSWKWSHHDKYRFQHNEFELIGYSSHAGKPCEYWTTIDFNLSTGKLLYQKEFEDCEKDQEIYKREEEVMYRKGIKLNLGNRNLKDIKIVFPKYKEELYL